MPSPRTKIVFSGEASKLEKELDLLLEKIEKEEWAALLKRMLEIYNS